MDYLKCANDGPLSVSTADENWSGRLLGLDLIGNGTIADALITNYLYPDQPVIELRLRYQLLDELTAADVTTLARIVFNPDQRIEVRLVPRS